jgi:hypothetical protein
MSNTMTPKQRKALNRVEVAGARALMPSARELFPQLRERLLGSRPIVGHTVEVFHANGDRTGGKPIFGKPTFRNVIEHGAHV